MYRSITNTFISFLTYCIVWQDWIQGDKCFFLVLLHFEGFTTTDDSLLILLKASALTPIGLNTLFREHEPLTSDTSEN